MIYYNFVCNDSIVKSNLLKGVFKELRYNVVFSKAKFLSYRIVPRIETNDYNCYLSRKERTTRQLPKIIFLGKWFIWNYCDSRPCCCCCCCFGKFIMIYQKFSILQLNSTLCSVYFDKLNLVKFGFRTEPIVATGFSASSNDAL